jgi:hypothetical protein
MRACEAKSADGRSCTLDVGHGGVHAMRRHRERKETTEVGKQIRIDQPTVVFETIATWADDGPARPHSVQR